MLPTSRVKTWTLEKQRAKIPKSVKKLTSEKKKKDKDKKMIRMSRKRNENAEKIDSQNVKIVPVMNMFKMLPQAKFKVTNPKKSNPPHPP